MKLLFVLVSSFFLFVNKIQAQTGITVPDGTGLPDPGATGGEGIKIVLIVFTSWLLTIFLILAVLSFVITGVMFLISMGDGRSQNLENAKQNFKYSIIAVVVVGASYIIIQFIDSFLWATLGA
jgi:hypothetical protein